MIIVNLTQHTATQAQIDAGVVDLVGEQREALIEALTFDHLPTPEEVRDRAEFIADLALCALLPFDEHGEYTPTDAMIGGAPFLMAPLEQALTLRCIRTHYAFSLRESVEVIAEDGSVRKESVFAHKGFVPAG